MNADHEDSADNDHKDSSDNDHEDSSDNDHEEADKDDHVDVDDGELPPSSLTTQRPPWHFAVIKGAVYRDEFG